MLHEQRRLHEYDTAFGIGEDDASALGTLHDLGVIEKRIESEQAELEPAATMLCTMAPAAVAARPRQDRHDLAREGDGDVRRRFADFDVDRFALARCRDGDRRLPIADRANE